MTLTHYYRASRSRQTGTTIIITHADDEGLDDGDGATAWYTICADRPDPLTATLW